MRTCVHTQLVLVHVCVSSCHGEVTHTQGYEHTYHLHINSEQLFGHCSVYTHSLNHIIRRQFHTATNKGDVTVQACTRSVYLNHNMCVPTNISTLSISNTSQTAKATSIKSSQQTTKVTTFQHHAGNNTISEPVLR